LAKAYKIKKLRSDDSAQKAAARILRKRLKEYFDRWANPAVTPTARELHDLRISGKRLRYSAEAFRDYYPDRLALLIQLLKDAQDLLGNIQDFATQRQLLLRELMRAQRKSPRSAEAGALRRLIADQERLQAELHEQFAQLWRGLSEKNFRKQLKTMVSQPLTSLRG
jgi:CHAD domain-containing protein